MQPGLIRRGKSPDGDGTYCKQEEKEKRHENRYENAKNLLSENAQKQKENHAFSQTGHVFFTKKTKNHRKELTKTMEEVFNNTNVLRT
ncbi:MAG: hypothetical protein LUI39_10025 [Lachnospiraceae bacterium]|nr:hypothetical protein [Lachnospiraceae bacterium]